MVAAPYFFAWRELIKNALLEKKPIITYFLSILDE